MAFKTALSGLNAAQADLNVIGNNIANVSTTGFKKSRAEFVDVYASSYQGISRLTAGSGVRVAQIQQNMSKGLTEYTDNNLDLAIQGNGFFVVEDNGSPLYSRAGMFSPDQDGYVVNSRGQRLQVFSPNLTTGTFNTGQMVDLRLDTQTGAPSATTSVELGLQLDAEATAPIIAFDPTDPTTYNYATSVTTYDSLGATHSLTTYYVKDALIPNTWYVYSDLADPVDTANGAVTGTGAGDSYAEPTAAGLPLAGWQDRIDGPHTIEFNPDGSLFQIDGAAAPTTISLSYELDNGAYGSPATPVPGPFSLDFTVDFVGATQYADDSGINFLAQDGYATGLLTGIDVDDYGVVTANYTNGLSLALGKVALATFVNPQGLQSAGDSTWLETGQSGEVIIGEPGTTNLGLIQGGALEASNVNLSEELVALIVAQRNFQANAQAITTENTVTQAIINI